MTTTKLAQEDPPPNEAEYIKDLGERLKAKIIRENPTGIMRRDAHPKMHGVVKAEFTVLPNLPAEYQVGIFKEAKTYQAWIRFSNQDPSRQADIKGDIRGMAIKLMNVPGQKLLPDEIDATTQDFLLISTPKFVTKDVQEFDDLIAAFTNNFLSIVWFCLTHLRVTWNLVTSLCKFASPLQIHYFSTTPYLFGDTACKYGTVPIIKNAEAIPSSPSADYLREAMVRQLAAGDAHFEFQVQRQTNAETMPIEDPGKEWSTEESPYRTVATIRILQQEFDTDAQRTFGENLSFTPWHSLPEHRPLGGVNRARKIVYNLISSFRHQYNKVERKEPNSWDIN